MRPEVLLYEAHLSLPPYQLPIVHTTSFHVQTITMKLNTRDRIRLRDELTEQYVMQFKFVNKKTMTERVEFAQLTQAI